MNIKEYKAIAKPRMQHEGIIQVAFGAFLKLAAASGKLSDNLLFYTYSGAGEKKHKTTAINQYRKGLRKGDPDYRFEVKNGDKMRVVYIEFKSQKGSLTPEQKDFFQKHNDLINAKCYLATTVMQARQILIDEQIYIND